MSVELYWISKTVVLEWKITNLSGAATDATVAATISKPDGTTVAADSIQNPAVGTYRALYDPSAAGWHAYRLTATGAVDSAEEGEFYVKRSLAGGAPPTFDPVTDVGRVRLLATDTDEDNQIFADEQISAFLAMEGDSVKLAAALVLETLASNEALVSKKIRTQDLQTDGPAVAKELRERAKSLRDQVAEDGEGDNSGFDIVDFDPWAGMSTGELAERGLIP